MYIHWSAHSFHTSDNNLNVALSVCIYRYCTFIFIVQWKKFYAQKSMKAKKSTRTELHIFWTEDIITKNKGQTWKVSLRIIFCVSSSFLPLLACVMCHISGCKQCPCWLRTGLASLCRLRELSHPFRWHIRLGTQTHTHSAKHFPNHHNPRVIGKA